MRSERNHRAALGLDARDLAVAEGIGAQWLLTGDRKHQRSRLPFARLQELFERYISGSKAPLYRDHRIERQQRDREITVGARRKEIAADGAHVAYGRTANRTGRSVQESEI